MSQRGFLYIQIMIAHSEEWGYVLFVYGFFCQMLLSAFCFSKAWSLSELNMCSFIVSLLFLYGFFEGICFLIPC